MSPPWWQCIAVVWNRTAQATLRNKPLKVYSVLGGAGTCHWIDIEGYTMYYHKNCTYRSQW